MIEPRVFAHPVAATGSDSEWKYVTLRRYVGFIEESLDARLQFAVFEPNDEPLWAKARGAVSDFLLDQWREGALVGARPEEAFFVKCDRTTMTQDDLDNGRLVCEIGVAPLRPAEFVRLRFAANTATTRA